MRRVTLTTIAAAVAFTVGWNVGRALARWYSSR